MHTCNAVAHIRRATVGDVRLENTHPFAYGNWLFAHNGTVAPFETIRRRLRALMGIEQERAIQGDTDSEYIFHWLLHLKATQPEQPLVEIVRKGLRQVLEWSDHEAPGTEVSMNIVITNGEDTVAVRLGRSLWFVERQLVHPCEVCDCEQHVKAPPPVPYRAVVVASEPVTRDEDWTRIPDGTLFHIEPGLGIQSTAL